jgi:transcriptional regulator with XRE-family HTH domain
MQGRRREVEVIPREQAAIVGANIRALRTGKGLTQTQVGELMGWTSNSTVCAAEGRRGGRQRSFTTDEVERLAGFFGIEAWQLTTRCVNCQGHPPIGFACLTCGVEATRGGRTHGGPRKGADPGPVQAPQSAGKTRRATPEEGLANSGREQRTRVRRPGPYR